MKYDITNIQIVEAFEENECECPICLMEKKAEEEITNIILSELLMETDFYTKLGEEFFFCINHFEKLYNYPDKLGMALIIKKLLALEIKNLKKSSSINDCEVQREVPKSILEGILGRKNIAKEAAGKPCYICSHMEKSASAKIEVMIKLWKRDGDFKNLYGKSKGFCMKHYKKIIDASPDILRSKDTVEEFQKTTLEIQKSNLERVSNDLEWFITKFDYRYKDAPWKNSKDALPRSILKVIGNM